MWPIIIAAIISAASGAASSALQPRPNSFGSALEGGMLSEGRGKVNDAWNMAMDNIGNGVHLRSSYVQPLPVYTGGGLPMPIGTTAQDPALANKSLLDLYFPGMSPNSSGGHHDPPFDDNGNPTHPDPSPSATGNSPGAAGPDDPTNPDTGGGNGHDATGPKMGADDLMGMFGANVPSPSVKSEIATKTAAGGPFKPRTSGQGDDLSKALSAFQLMGMNF